MSTRGDRKTGKNSVTNQAGRKVKATAKRSLFNSVEKIVQNVGTKISSCVDSLAGGLRLAATPSFESLESRQLLAAVPLTVGQFTLYDSSAASPNDVNVVALAAGTTGGVTAVVTTVDNGISAGNDSVTSIVVTGPGTGAAVTVNLMVTGPINGPVTYVGAGDLVTFNYFNEAANDAAGGGYIPVGQTSGFTTTAVVANADTGNAVADDDDITADGSLNSSGSAVNLSNAVVGGTIRNTVGSVGTIALGGGTLTSTLLIETDAAASSTAGVTITGAVTLGAFNITAHTAEGAATGGTVSIASGSTITIAGAGGITINSDFTGNGSAGVLGNTILGNLSIAAGASGDIAIASDGGNANMGALTIGTVTNASTGGSSITAGASGNGGTGAVSIDAITMTGNSATNDIAIGSATSTVASITLNGISNGDANNGADVTFSSNNLTGALALGTGAYVADNGGSIAVTVAGNLGSLTGTGSLSVTNDDAGGGISIAVAGTAGAVTLGAITNNNTAAQAISLAFDSNGTGTEATASFVQTGAININDLDAGGIANTVQTGNVTITFGSGVTGALTIGNVFVGDSGDADTADFSVTATANNTGFGAVTTGTLSTDGTGGCTITIDNNGTGSMAGVTLGAVTIGGTGDNHITVGHLGGAAATTNLGNVTLGALTNTNNNTASDLTVQAADIGNVTIAGIWSLSSAGDVNITALAGVGVADAGVLGTIGGNTWDVNFSNGLGPVINIFGADGIGTITAGSVDFLDANVAGNGFNINANSDGDDTGPVGDITVRNAGDDATNSTAFVGSVTATDGSNVSVAGGISTSTFDATSGTLNTGDWGTFAIGIDIAAAAVDNSDSPSLTITSDDGIGTITLSGLNSQLTAANVQANVDADAVGSLGNVTVSGEAGANSLTSAATWNAVDFGNFALTDGNFNVSLDNNITLAVDRIATTSNVGTITVSDGSITGGSLTIDDGIGNISVNNLTPINGTATFGTIITDADAGDAGLAIGGGIGTITTTGTLTITTLNTNGVADTTNRASEDAGAILAGSTIAITTLNLGGSIPSITIVETSPVGARTITIGTLTVSGNLDTITSGLGAGDDITITNASTIFGDLDRINAGAGNVAIANGLRVAAGTHSSPVYVVTDTGVDYIFDVAGTWNAGGNAASVDATITFAGGNTNSVNIADLEGTTSATDTDLILATRLNATGAVVNYSSNLGPDTSTALYSLAGFQDDYSTVAPLQDGRHSFRLIEIEGNLNGAIGADANASDGSANTIAGTAAILGTIRNLEIIGNWNNTAGGIKVLAVDELSFGSLTADRIAGIAAFQFSFDSPSGVGGDGVLPPGGNSNGTSEDLEAYTALAGTSQTNIVVPLPDGGSLTKSVVGPTGAFETIRLSDLGADGIIDTVVLTFGSGGDAGKLRTLDLFGENIGIEYNAVDPSNSMTDSSTNINYGIARNDLGLAATNVSAAGQNAIDFLETSGALGNITVVDADVVATAANEAIDQVPVGVGNISVGYVVTLDGASDITTNGGVASYINDPNDGTGNGSTLALVAGVPVYAGIGNITVDGPLGGIVSSGGVGTITTNDTVDETLVAAPPAGTATFAGLVTDGSAGAITINGTVGGSLVVGDSTITSTGADLAFGGAGLNADTVGITGVVSTARFLGAITVHDGNLGTTEGSVTGLGGNAQLPSIAGDEVSAPYGVGVAITVDLPTGLTADPGTGAGQLRAAVVSGKHTLVDPATGAPSQASDDITGNITAVDIVGDIWSGDDIAANITATGITAFLSGTTAVTVGDAARGNISSQGANAVLNISATGASAGDITANVLADGNLNNIFIDAGIGTGGSINANIIGGTDGTGGFTGTNTLNADQNIGLADNSNVISAADDIVFGTVAAGLQTTVDPLTPLDVIDGGNINADFSAGIPVGQTVPVGAPGSAFTTGIADANIPTYKSDDDTVTITTFDAGNVDGPDADGNVLNDLNSNLNGTLAAASSITVTTTHIDGNAVGNNGTAGGHVAAAGLGWLGSGTPFAAGVGNHAILTLGTGGGSVIVGDLSGTVSGGLFVPFDNTNNSPLNPNDLASLQSGTVLTLGEVVLGAPGTLSVGRWLQDGTGVNGGEAGISLTELREGTESGANVAFAPTTSVGSTHNASVNVAVVGRPFAAPQTGPGTVTPNPADGDGTNISILSFGSVTGTTTFSDSASFNFIVSNADAINAIDTAGNGNPSSSSTNGRFNSSTASGTLGTDITLNVTASGNGTGGLSITYLLAGYDYFANQAGGPATNAPAGSTATNGVATTGSANNALHAFGVGSIAPSGAGYHANDGDPTDGLEAGDFTFGFIGAGTSISGAFAAQDDLTAVTANDFINGTNVGITGATRASVAAGLSANAAMDGLGTAGLFLGGNNGGQFVAGDDVAGPNNGKMLFTAQGSSTSAVAGNFSATFAVVSGSEDQFADATSSSNLNAILVASGSFTAGAKIDAGDTLGLFGGVTGGGLGGASGTNVGSFVGGVIAGAGPDLLIGVTADNNLGADMNATIRTVGNLDVTGIGILAEDNMAAAIIEVGYGPNGGNLLGNIVAEGTINEIEVFGNIGSAGTPSLIYSGDLITKLGIGDAASIVTAGFNNVRPASAYISSFGTLFGSIFEAGDTNGGGSSATTADTGASIFVGGSVPAGSNISVGSQWGAASLTIEIHGNVSNFVFGSGEGDFSVTGGAVNSVDVIATDGDNTGNTGPGISLTVTSSGPGPFAGIRNFIAGDNLGDLTVTGGGVTSIVVNDDTNITATVAAQLTALAISPSQFTFLTNSLPTVSEIVQNFNNDIALVTAGDITVEGDIGDNTDIGVGMNVAMTNVAINVQGNQVGSVTSTRGSVGNILIGGSLLTGGVTFEAHTNLGDIFVTQGGTDGDDSYISDTGSIGVISVRKDIDNPTITAVTNLGGLIARTGFIDMSEVGVLVHGSIGLIEASGDIFGDFTAETGDIGVDLDTNDKFTLGDSSSNLPAGIYSDAGNIDIRAIAGNDIGNIKAKTGSIISAIDDDDITFTTTGTAGIDFTSTAGAAGGPGGAGGNIDTGGGVNNGNANGGAGGAGGVITNAHGSGTIVIHSHNSEEDDSILRAGHNIGSLTAFKDIGVYVLQAGNNIGDLTAQIGTVGATAPFALAVPDIGGFGALLTTIGMGTLTVTAGGNVGNITGGTGVGTASPATLAINGVNVSFDSGTVFVTSTGGSVGNVEAKTGNVGGPGSPVTIRANGGVSIDPDTLQLAARPVNGRAGVGNVFADIGSIWIDLISGGDVGVSGATVHGGIAAPLGSITGAVTIGGDLGGLSAGQAVNVTSTILGKSGVFRNPSGGTASLSSGSALNIDANGVAYVVLASNASGSVAYHVSGHNVIFDTVTLTQGTGGGAGIQITNASAGNDADAQAQVKLLNITGNASNITVDGSVDKFNVSGNLTDGSVIITGSGGDGHVHGNIGNPGNADGNAFAADGLSVQVGQGFSSLKADSHNFGLVNATIANGSYISFANSLRLATGQGDGFITAYLGSGKATVAVNNGYIESITFVGGTASDLVVLTNPSSLEANFSDAKATAKGVNTKIDNLLAAQSGLVASGDANTGNLYNRIFEAPVILNSSVPGGALGLVDSTSAVGNNNTAHVGRIVSGGSSVQLTNVIVEGNVKSVNLGYNGSVKNLVTAGNLGTVFAGRAQGVDVRGNAGTIDGAKNVSGVKVAGNADVIKSSGAISNVSVAGNAGVISAGAKLSRTAVGGSAITINGATLENVNVAGSAGLQVAGAAAGSLGLGSAFSAADAARILGSDDLASIGNVGPNGSLFLGGISGRNNNTRVAVGGLISELVLSKDSNALSNLLGQTVDDAFVGVDKTNAFVKKDGVLIKFPSGTSSVIVQELSQPAAAPDDSRI